MAKKKKATDFFTAFYIFCESGIKIFLQWHPLTGPLLKLWSLITQPHLQI